MTAPINCPSCGAPVPFQSRTSVSATCAFCKSVVVRTDMRLEDLGKFAQLLDDMTPLQIGTQGVYKKRSFIVLGRARWKWEDGFWNEWHMAFSTGAPAFGWLGEAQGQFYPCFPAGDEPLPPAALRPGFQVSVGGQKFEVADVKTATCIGCEGELPLVIRPGTVKVAADCGNEAGGYACLEREGDEVRGYLGSVEDADSLKFTNLRALDGW